MAQEEDRPPEGTAYIFRASITLPDGTRIYARQFGKRAFKIPVSPTNDNGEKAA